MAAGVIGGGGYFQPKVIVVLKFLLFEAVVKLRRHDGFDSDAILASQWVVLAVAIVVHVVSTHVTADLGVLVHTFQFLPLWVAVVLESDRIVCQSASPETYPLVLAVLFTPMRWFLLLYSSRSFIFCW